MARFFKIHQWVGPGYADYKLKSIHLNVSEGRLLCYHIPKKNSHLFLIEEFDQDPNIESSNVIGRINGEEFLADPEANICFF